MRQTGDILVVDDEVDIVNLVVDILQDEGYQVRSAFNGEMALAAIAQQQPAMILMDMYMPQMTGIMLLEHLRTNGISAIPVVLMTASPRAAETLLNMELVDYLAKPFDIDELLQCVARNFHYHGPTDTSRISSEPASQS
jgi:CheY-like chemotaxis protein